MSQQPTPTPPTIPTPPLPTPPQDTPTTATPSALPFLFSSKPPLQFQSQQYPQYNPLYDPPPIRGIWNGRDSPPSFFSLITGDAYDRAQYHKYIQQQKIQAQLKQKQREKLEQLLREPVKDCSNEWKRLVSCLKKNEECMKCEKEFDEMDICQGYDVL